MEAHWVPPGGLSPELAQSCSEGSYFHNGFGVEGSASQAAYALYWLQNPSQGPEPEVAAAAALELIASMEAQARPCDDVETHPSFAELFSPVPAYLADAFAPEHTELPAEFEKR